MNNKILAGGVVAIIIIAGIYFLSQKQYQPGPSQTLSPRPSTESAQNKVEANTITIQNFAFNPGNITVKVGTRVTWINQDSATHRIKSDTFNSPDLNQGDKFEFTFNNQGSFDYICGIHPSMNGKIVVE